ncbi:MAG: hypothetical protein KY475_26945 [Planctomycetes bacterium]|nr:hypothetical protein [Planctomycetota bacterium]
MNRTVLLGIAIFIAVLGIALVGGEDKAVAGQRCNCYCDCACAGCDCAAACHGRQGLLARLRARRHACHGCHSACHCDAYACHGCHAYSHCCGYVPACHGGCHGGYEGAPYDGGAPVEAPPPDGGDAGEGTPAPPPAAALDRAPVAYRQVSFRR